MDFVPNVTKRFVSHEPPWITETLKTMLNRKVDSTKTTIDMGTRKRTKLGLTHSLSNVTVRLKMLNHPTYPLWETKLINLVLLKNIIGKLLTVL